jgi:23S rRNA (cytidine1920-2'-O)/16S rRNA (cytidine1409-2'-O)-methyltransferase
MAKPSTRLDKLLVDRGVTASRQRAEALILAGKAVVNGHIVTKAGQRVAIDSEITLLGPDHPYVSRGGIKLEHALRSFLVDVTDLVAMDVGASTGGFTDCLLQHGARRVYAIDVGYGQLAWKLRQDPRVVVRERQNVRYLPLELIPEPIQLVTMDASFISLTLVIPAVLPFLAPHAGLVALIKPQFEAGREHVGKKGVVRDPQIHQLVCQHVKEFCEGLGLAVLGILPSPILGPEGNKEFLLAAKTVMRA